MNRCSQPERYLHNNAAKSDVLIDAALRHGVDVLVFSSSCAVYGLPQTDLLAETHPIAPISPYAESKARVERALAAAAARGLRSAALRYFNAAGADAGGAIGEAHHPETHLLPLAADAALGLGPDLTLLGTDYPTPDGSCIRDFVHVSDLADAHLRALDWLQRASGRGLHEAFNLGSGTGYSVRQAIAETARIAGRAVPHTVGPRRPGDSPKLVGDIAKARRELGWTAHARPCGPDRGHAALAPQDAALTRLAVDGERDHRSMNVSPRTRTSILVRRKQSMASSGLQTTGSFSLKLVLSTIGTPVRSRKDSIRRA